MTTTSVEDNRKRLKELRTHLAEGATQAARQDFVENFDVKDVVARAKSRVGSSLIL